MDTNPRKAVQLGVHYRHFRNKQIYTVINIATHTETCEELVIYCSKKEPHTTWARPYNAFLENVQDGDYNGPRFILVE